jgi:hypothetical protein
MVVDKDVQRSLGAVGGRELRIFVASCAERLSQVFCAIRASDPSRAEDIAYVVESLEDLWNLEIPAEPFGARRERLESFPEFEPTEVGLIEVADIYSFYGLLVLMYAVGCAASGDPREAVSCAHVALTAMGQLDQNIVGASFFSEEKVRQAEVLDLVERSVALFDIRHNDSVIGQRRAEAILARLEHR